jgi:fructuronate reductase
MPIRLKENLITKLGRVRKPDYDRSKISAGILHIGIGGFHRAHQAIYTEDLLAAGEQQWGIIGASLRSTAMRERLAPQDFLYTVCTRHPEHDDYRVVGAIQDILTLSHHCSRLIALIASPTIKVIMLTITEKGYCLGASGLLDESHPDIQHDIVNPLTPVSAAGLLSAGLKRREENSAGPITIISCDNLSANGHCTRQSVTRLSRLQSENNLGWINDNVQFPNTMVDRIVPETTEADRARFTHETGFEDSALVVCEPFSQWIIEEKFAAERPEWASTGALIVEDVTVYEQMKLSMLNATHSALAYLGLLAGHEYIHETMQDPILSHFADYLLQTEIIPVTQRPAGFDLNQYKDSILARFSNSQIQYRTTQVANDGSQKLPQRIFPNIHAQLSQGKTSPGLMLAVAAWLKCMTTPDIANRFVDPQGDDIKTYTGNNIGPFLLSVSNLFGDLGKDMRFINGVADKYTELSQNSVQTVIQRLSKRG